MRVLFSRTQGISRGRVGMSDLKMYSQSPTSPAARILSTGTWTGFFNLYPLKNRSEEHTSELQSRLHLVCRLLLEKKKHRRCPFVTHMHDVDGLPLPAHLTYSMRRPVTT